MAHLYHLECQVVTLWHKYCLLSIPFVTNFSTDGTFVVSNFSLSAELCVSPGKADAAGTGRTSGRVQKENLGIKYLSC